MKRREHHASIEDAKLLTFWKVTNFLSLCLCRGYHVGYYKDTGRIHYWKQSTKEYHIIAITNIIDSQTGLDVGVFDGYLS